MKKNLSISTKRRKSFTWETVIVNEFNEGIEEGRLNLPQIIMHALKDGDSLKDFAEAWQIPLAELVQYIRSFRLVRKCAMAAGIKPTTVSQRLRAGAAVNQALSPAWQPATRARYAALCRWQGKKAANLAVKNRSTDKTKIRRAQDKEPGLSRFAAMRRFGGWQ